MSALPLYDFEIKFFNSESDDEVEIIDVEESLITVKSTPDDLGQNSRRTENEKVINNCEKEDLLQIKDSSEGVTYGIVTAPIFENSTPTDVNIIDENPLGDILKNEILEFRKGHNLHSTSVRWRQIDQISLRRQRCLRLMATINSLKFCEKTSAAFEAARQGYNKASYEIDMIIKKWMRSQITLSEIEKKPRGGKRKRSTRKRKAKAVVCPCSSSNAQFSVFISAQINNDLSDLVAKSSEFLF